MAFNVWPGLWQEEAVASLTAGKALVLEQRAESASERFSDRRRVKMRGALDDGRRPERETGQHCSTRFGARLSMREMSFR